MAKSKQGPRAKLKELVEELKKDFERWSIIITSGANDPNWPDGTNANLVRNHIRYHKDQITELCSENDLSLPEIFNHPTPEEVSQDFMAKPDEIRTNAQKSLALIKNDADYLYLKEMINTLSPQMIYDTSINNILSYVSSLQRAINEDNFVIMQRMGKPDHCLDSFHRCATKVRELSEEFQLQRQVNISDPEIEPLTKPQSLSISTEQQVTKQLDFSTFA